MPDQALLGGNTPSGKQAYGDIESGSLKTGMAFLISLETLYPLTKSLTPLRQKLSRSNLFLQEWRRAKLTCSVIDVPLREMVDCSKPELALIITIVLIKAQFDFKV